MKILFLANLIPFPLDGGGKIFTFSTIKALSTNNEVDLLCFYEKEDVKQATQELLNYCKSVKALPIRVTTNENKSYMMKKAFSSLFSSRPLAVSKYFIPQMKTEILQYLQKDNYDCVFMNLLAMGVYEKHIRKYNPNIKIVLYEQNCEALIYKRLFTQEKNFLKKIFVGIEYNKLKRFENKIIHSVDKVIVLSDEDRQNLEIKEATIIPIGVQPQSYQKDYSNISSKTIHMLFVGTMTWAPNSEGIVWFLSQVMPLCSDKSKYDLTIVGKNPSDKVCNLANQYPNVHILGYVDNLDDVFDSSDVLIVPLFIGSGQRVKILEAFAKNFAVISTTIGAEGIKYRNNETIMIADSPEEFKSAIDKCVDRDLISRIAAGGKAIFESTYSTEVIAQQLNDAIQ